MKPNKIKTKQNKLYFRKHRMPYLHVITKYYSVKKFGNSKKY